MGPIKATGANGDEGDEQADKPRLLFLDTACDEVCVCVFLFLGVLFTQGGIIFFNDKFIRSTKYLFVAHIAEIRRCVCVCACVTAVVIRLVDILPPTPDSYISVSTYIRTRRKALFGIVVTLLVSYLGPTSKPHSVCTHSTYIRTADKPLQQTTREEERMIKWLLFSSCRSGHPPAHRATYSATYHTM